MSFKGFQKAIVRAPQNFRQKLNMGTTTQDAVYIDAERRFQELEEETKRLADVSKSYHKAVNEMLDHQVGFSKAIEEIYKPISGRMSDPNSAIPEGNPEGIEACEQFRDVLNDLKDTLKPDLELIQSRIIDPANQLLEIIKSIRKMATKRNHKQLDLDRHQNSLSKIQNKSNRSAKDEERVYKYENDVAIAQQEFDYYNEMMKQELPILFQLEGQFIKPLFVSLYYMQLNVFYTLASRMEEMKIPYFDLSQDIIEAYNIKRGDVEERTESIGITNFKMGHAKNKLELTRRRFELQQEAQAANGVGAGGAPGTASTFGTASTVGSYGAPQSTVPTTAQTYGSAPAYGQPPAAGGYGQAPNAYGQEKTGYGQAPNAYGQEKTGYGQAPPNAYGQEKANYGYGSPVSAAATAASFASNSPTGAAPPAYGSPVYGAPAAAAGSPLSPVSPTPAFAAPAPVPAGETCTALYDYAAQTAGDLSFRAGDVITIVQRTNDQNGWWTGSVNGVQGVFPGNYVQLN